MKKICLLIFVLYIFYDELHIVDLSMYQSKYKSVEVKGEVRYPGVYEVNVDATTNEILKLAGGCTKDGDLSSLNLNLNIENNAVIVIGKKREKTKISLNSATLAELDSLNGIGASIAQRIIDYRQVHPFKSIQEIMNVKGIGEKLFEKIKEEICL